MAGQLRPDKKAMKIFWDIMKTPKALRQKPDIHPDKKLLKMWYRDSVINT
jgi:hypothetical protein